MNFCGRILVLVCLLFSVQAYSEPNSANSGRGKALFNLCISCHGLNGQGNPEIGAPSIAGLPQWYIETELRNFMSGARGLHPSDDAGNRMRPMARTITPQDIPLVAAYVSALQPYKPVATVGGNAEKGKTYFAVCISCHGQKGEGNPAVHAPPLKNSNDWYLVRQLVNFKSQIRAYDGTKDAMGMTMRGMASTLPNEEAMKDVITYAQSLN